MRLFAANGTSGTTPWPGRIWDSFDKGAGTRSPDLAPLFDRRSPVRNRETYGRPYGGVGRPSPSAEMGECLHSGRAIRVFLEIHLCRSVTQMAKSKKKAETVFLVCKETGDYNYTTRRKPGGEKLKIKKYCPRLRKHTLHTEKKK